MSLLFEFALLLCDTNKHDSSVFCDIYCKQSKHRIKRSSAQINISVDSRADRVMLCLKSADSLLSKKILEYDDLLRIEDFTLSMDDNITDKPIGLVNIKRIKRIKSPSQENRDTENRSLSMLNEIIHSYNKKPSYPTPSALKIEDKKIAQYEFMIRGLRKKIADLLTQRSLLRLKIYQESDSIMNSQKEIADIHDYLTQVSLQKSQSFESSNLSNYEDLAMRLESLEIENKYLKRENYELSASRNIYLKDEEHKLMGKLSSLQLQNERLQNEVQDSRSKLNISKTQRKQMRTALENSYSLVSDIKSHMKKTANEDCFVQEQSIDDFLILKIDCEVFEMLRRHKIAVSINEKYRKSFSSSENPTSKNIKKENLKLSSDNFTRRQKSIDLENSYNFLSQSSEEIDQTNNEQLELTIPCLRNLLRYEKNRVKISERQLRFLFEVFMLQSFRRKCDKHAEKNLNDLVYTKYIGELKEHFSKQIIEKKSTLFYYEGKRLFVKMENGQIIIRIGGGYMLIDEFVRLFKAENLEKLKKVALMSEVYSKFKI